ncbi:asparagine synthase (glutamine-hydrolyzing) [Oceanibaculum pacificum]|uniref:asparagine synthase (glutamine-hydrolyzing) n=1 Tax=Oceanibaculum pacificum TaxID=580166 RepID=A0A154VH60_9PROT|nr:asparagine synthase (glutamine-hydrolyzing) [Oceanibaculum pacificum]KZD00610.1 asparagine synthetase B [Oceanibaculum pacificum]
MCGIAGLWDRRRRLSPSALAEANGAMTAALARRGPDDEGRWEDAEAGIALGHRRLAIIDLSPAGHEPMVSADGRLVLTYNGEVYNFPDLRRELAAAGASFRGDCDAEVMLEGFARWGVAATVEKLVGMFAFALWDRRDRTLTLGRDRLGKKPLYWGEADGLLLFGSELKALAACPHWRREIDRDSVAAFLRHAYVPSPHSIYRGIHKLPPGCLVEIPAEGEPALTRYWDLESVALAGLADPLPEQPEAALDLLEPLLRDAVARRMVADVPLGVLLSGGIDSSLVAALMQAGSDRPIRSFTIGFQDSDLDEAPLAGAVARHLGADHTQLYLTEADARNTVPELPEIYDEPFADASQIPTLLVSRLARGQVTVALGGDGGDELFGGYHRHRIGEGLWRKVAEVPRPMRKVASALLKMPSSSAWAKVAEQLPARYRPPMLGDKVGKLAAILPLDGPDAMYRRLVTHWPAAESLVPGAGGRLSIPGDLSARMPDPFHRARLMDAAGYLPDDVLTKVDRASMACGLEVRAPLLDHRVAALAWRFPKALLHRDGKSKWPLRQILARHVPADLFERPKAGFSVPIDGWLRGPLRDWAESLLSAEALARDGLLQEKPIRAAWRAHQDGARDHGNQLWAVLMLQAWRQRRGF